MYVKYTNRQLTPTSRPSWYDETGSLLSDEALCAEGVYLVVDNPPAYNPATHSIAKNPVPDWAAKPDGASFDDPASVTHIEVTYTVTAYTEAELRIRLKAAATQKRWDVMTAGVTISGVSVATDIEDQNRIASVVANAALAGLTDESEVDFKAESGWIRLSIGAIKQIAGVIGLFVQGCYTAERSHHEALDSISVYQELIDYDLDAFWPAQET